MNSLILLVTFAHASTSDERGVYEVMTVLNDSATLTMLDEDLMLQAAFGSSKLPKGMKLIIDKNLDNAPEGKYRVFAVPENSEFEIKGSEKEFEERGAFSMKYDEYKKKLGSDCSPTDIEPYKCLPAFYIDRDNVGAEKPLEVQVVETATTLNETIKSVTVPECDDCQNELKRKTEEVANVEVPAKKLGDQHNRDCMIRLSGSMVNCNSKDKTTRSWYDAKKMVCLFQASGEPFCPNINKDLERIEIIADILGFDRRQMACIALIESGFKQKTTSSAGAQGVAQFLRGTAGDVVRNIKARYQNEWNEYQKRIGGTPFPVSSITTQNILTGHKSFGLFAMGVYLREITSRFSGNHEEKWKQYIQGGGNPRYLFHAQIVGYNWKPARIKNMTNETVSGNSTPYSFVRRRLGDGETTSFIEKFNDCMYTDSGWRFNGKKPPASRASKCKLNSKKPLCG